MSETGVENGFMRPTRLPYRVLYALLFACVLFITALLLPGRLRCCSQSAAPVLVPQEPGTGSFTYNATYPLTPPRSESQPPCPVIPAVPHSSSPYVSPGMAVSLC